MRFLLLDTDYPDFLGQLYGQRPELWDAPLVEQERARLDTLYGVADFYVSALRELGHEARELSANNSAAQLAWAREHGARIARPWGLVDRLRKRYFHWPLSWSETVLIQQIEDFAPDVILNRCITTLTAPFWRRAKGARRFLLVGQHASPLPAKIDLTPYDLLVSSLPNLVETFRAAGRTSAYLPLGFGPAVLERLPAAPVQHEVSFVGSISSVHTNRVRWLERLCRELPVKVWGQGAEALPWSSPIRAAHQGPAFGREMYRVLQTSRITLNNHIDMAGRFANNMRLYEATGTGALLVTEAKENLHELFRPGEEVVTYRDTDECIERVRYYLTHEPERAAIAAAGQRRTLTEHTYRARMERFVERVELALSGAPVR
jgi:hypothetical protein